MFLINIFPYRKFDGLLWRDAHELRHQPPVQPRGPLVPHHLLEAVEAVLVQHLAHVGGRPLILHARLDQVDGVHGGGAGGAGDGAQGEAVHGLEDLDHHAAVLGALEGDEDDAGDKAWTFRMLTDTACSSVILLVICFMYCSGAML